MFRTTKEERMNMMRVVLLVGVGIGIRTRAGYKGIGIPATRPYKLAPYLSL
jgi:hypothetical protein